MTLSFLLSLFLSPLSWPAQAQIISQPTELIEATPLTPFSERSGYWPSTTIPTDTTTVNASGFTDFFNSVPGVQAREGGSPTLSIRGSAQASRVLSLFEDVPLNLADGVGASSLLIPKEVLGEIDLFKGPASVFYGASAMGGAVNHRLRVFERPAVRGLIADEGGKFGTRSLTGIVPVSVGADKKDYYQVSGFHETTPGEFPFQSTTTSLNGRRYNNGSVTQRLTFSGEQSLPNTRLRERVIFANRSGASPGALPAPVPSYFDDWAALGSLGAHTELNQDLEFGLRGSSIYSESTYDAGTSTFSKSITTKNAASADVTVTEGIVRLKTFADFNHNELRATYNNNQLYVENPVELGQSYEISLSELFILQPGFRYHGEYGAFYKSLGLFAEATRSRFWTTYSEGFRPPSLSDRFAQTSFFRGNPGLRPEKSQQFEIGSLRRADKQNDHFLEGLSYGASLYYMRYTDSIDTTSTAGVLGKVNAGTARVYGVEASYGYALRATSFSFAYNYLNTKNEDTGEELRLSPRHQVTLLLAQQLGPVVFELKNTYWSEFRDRNVTTNVLQTLPAWDVYDFNIRTIGLTDYEFKAGILNIFDEARELTIGYPEPQRRFYLSALRFF